HARYRFDLERAAILAQLARLRHRPLDRILADDASVPALRDKIITADDFTSALGKRDKHLHHARLDLFIAEELERRLHDDTADREIPFTRQINRAHGAAPARFIASARKSYGVSSTQSGHLALCAQ